MRLSERARLKLDSLLPAPLGYRLDLLRPLRFYGGPMNGQGARQRLVRELMRAVAFDEIVETGTYRGVTTTFLSDVSGLPVHTAEVSPRYVRYARVRCATHPSVTVHHRDSRDLLRELAARPGAPTLFCYLDAHWGEDVPRHDELRIIHARWPRAVVMIDDFQVHDDPGYAYTRYGGAPLNLDYLPELPGWRPFYPATRAAAETGDRRGCLVLATAALAPAVAALDGLRPAGRHLVPTPAT
ncbi:hypothetical protein [Streptomyces sp. NPDC059009]|uniref:hypothetical protein n=1 Tax=Streptomyces sp. NPDC059009 TaxID=3346694 RepID=UPI0036867F15